MLTTEQYKTIIRQGTKEDAPRILELFNKVIPQYKRDIQFWEWINNMGTSNSLISIAEYKDQIIGHYCVIPRILTHLKSDFKVGMGIHAIVDKEHKDKTSIIDITQHSHQLSKDNGLVMLYGFPNQNYQLIQEKIERWDVISRYDALLFDKKLLDIKDTSLKLIPYNNINFKEFKNKLKNISRKTYTIELKCPLSYYFNRYFNHPHSIYEPYWVYNNSKIVGFVVLKNYDKNLGHIIDYYIDSNIDLACIINLSLKYLEPTKIALWDTNFDFKKIILSTQNNIEKGFKTNFFAKFLNKDFETKFKQEIVNINNWHLPMGTSDAF